MMNEALGTPVLFLIFNRPDTTQRVFAEIRKARPARLFVAADGPREAEAEDARLCEAAREIIRHVDWECDLHTNLHEKNLGLKVAVSSAIGWFFDHVEAGIILEDDCLPSQSFFRFCRELLDRYHDDKRVMQISGSNYLFENSVTEESYYFSKLNDVWGWATWKRAWEYYDVNMKTFPQFKEEGQLQNYIDDPEIRAWLMTYLEEAHNAAGGTGLWSSQWTYAICAHNGLTIVPSVNLVANIGFSGEATHKADSFALYSRVDRQEIGEMVHPPFVLPNKRADALRFEIIRKTDPRLLYAERYRWKQLARRYVPVRYRRMIKNLAGDVKRLTVGTG